MIAAASGIGDNAPPGHNHMCRLAYHLVVDRSRFEMATVSRYQRALDCACLDGSSRPVVATRKARASVSMRGSLRGVVVSISGLVVINNMGRFFWRSGLVWITPTCSVCICARSGYQLQLKVPHTRPERTLAT